MADKRHCPDCGCELTADAPQGHCPNCLLKAGFESKEKASGFDATMPSPPHGEAAGIPSDYSPPDPKQLSDQLPQLEVLELLGYGGMGAVYKARQKSLDRFVALKLIKADLAAVGGFSDRFEREAKALAKLNHPNIVGVHDFGAVNGQYYLVMEFVDGTDLRRLIATKEIKPEQAIAIVPQICAALQYAHDQGIVHRDIKPENILIDTSGQIKIADFGLAKLLGDNELDHGLTATNQVMGTLKYMAPEQMEGSSLIDHRADIYSLGVVFYELLTGDLPLGRFVAPSQKAAIDNRLDEIVMRALERELPQRYQQASDMKAEVERLSDPVIEAEPLPPSPYAAAPNSGTFAESHTDNPWATHVRILAAIHIAFGAIFAVLAVFVFFAMPSIGIMSDDAEAIRVLSIIGMVAASALTLLGLPGLLTGIGLWKFQTWSRFAAMVLAVLNLLNFPFGTAISVYTFWALLNKDCAALFGTGDSQTESDY